MEKKPLKRKQESKELMREDIPFVPYLLNEAYSEDEPEYTTEDLIWKNPKFNQGSRDLKKLKD